MNHLCVKTALTLLCAAFIVSSGSLEAEESQTLVVAGAQATMRLAQGGELRSYEIASNAILRDNQPENKRVAFSEVPQHARIRTGNLFFDGLYALAVHEALQNSVLEIRDGAYANGAPIRVNAYQTGAKWSYVWTRDLAYSLHLSLAGFDPARAADSLLFKASPLKASIRGGLSNQMVQDTGSGGSYPISSDRVVWAMGAHETLKYLSGAERVSFLKKIYPVFRDTIEQDRRLVFDPKDGLYRGEHSFLDWREQTYPGWTANHVLAIGMSKAVSVNAANYFLLNTAAGYAAMLGHHEAGSKYRRWAVELRSAINQRFFDEDAGLYRTYLLSDDGTYDLPVNRYDLLGQSLAILHGVADEKQAERIVGSYPTGPFGPPVIWPGETSVAIYHNQGIWPFVTGYWTKAARKAGNAAAVDAGIESLYRLAAVNLSNMENYDFITGRAEVTEGPRQGPVINSQRQLWSVAAYLSMVQEVVFGLETTLAGIRFQPFLTAKSRNETFGYADMIEMKNLVFRGTRNNVSVHLPPAGGFSQGVCTVESVTLNGKTISEDFVSVDRLQSQNHWEIHLKAPAAGGKADSVRMVDVSNEAAIVGPVQPEWDDSLGGIKVRDGRLTLHYRHPNAPDVAFNIYRNGELYAKKVSGTSWTDPESGDYEERVYSYSVEAAFPASGTVSHPTPARSFRTSDQQQVISASDMMNRGGELSGNHHFENWGKPEHTLVTKPFQVKRSGHHVIRMVFSNGAGPVNTGITCAVKKLEVRNARSGEMVASGYLVMPHSGDWQRWDLSNAIAAELDQGELYSIGISEDPYSRNMSYLQSNQRYTGWPGGGERPSNHVNFSAAHVLYLKPSNLLSREGGE